jgi:hypothetical protein
MSVRVLPSVLYYTIRPTCDSHLFSQRHCNFKFKFKA